MSIGSTILIVGAAILYGTHARLGPNSPAQNSYACYGSLGLNQTVNNLSCSHYENLSRICIQSVKYASKRPKIGVDCPVSGLSEKVDPACCESDRDDCLVHGTEDKKAMLVEACANQSASNCRLQSDYISSVEFSECSGNMVNTYRSIRYVCIADDDFEAKGRHCYSPVFRPTTPPTTPTPKTTVTDILASITHKEWWTSPPATRVPPKKKTTEKTSTTESTAESQSGLSSDEKIIVGVSVSILGVIFAVIIAAATRAYLRRKSLRKKNKWIENNLTKDQLNNKNQTPVYNDPERVVDGEAKPPTVEAYQVVNEVANTTNNSTINADEPIAPPVSNNKNIFEIKSIGNNQYQQVGLSPNNPLYKSTGFAPPRYEVRNNRPTDTKLPRNIKIVSNKLDVSRKNVRNKSSKRKTHTDKHTEKDSDTQNATLRKVAKFVKEYIREVDENDDRRKKIKPRRRRNSSSDETEIKTTHKKKSSRRDKEDGKIRVKPWNFIRGSRDDSPPPRRKKKRANYENARVRRSFREREIYYDNNEDAVTASSHSSEESSEEMECRFPIRQQSIMKRRTKKASNSESLESTSESEQSARPTSVRFHRKLTYIEHPGKRRKKRDKSKHHRRDEYERSVKSKSRRRSRDRDDDYERDRKDSFDLNDARIKRRTSKQKRLDEESDEQQEKHRRRRDPFLRNRDDDTKINTKRNSMRVRVQSSGISKRSTSKRKVKSKSARSKTKHVSKSQKRRQTDEYNKEYITDSDEYTDEFTV